MAFPAPWGGESTNAKHRLDLSRRCATNRANASGGVGHHSRPLATGNKKAERYPTHCNDRDRGAVSHADRAQILFGLGGFLGGVMMAGHCTNDSASLGMTMADKMTGCRANDSSLYCAL